MLGVFFGWFVGLFGGFVSYLTMFLGDKIASMSLYPIHYLLKCMSFGANTHFVKKPKEAGWPAAHQCPQISIFPEVQASQPHSTHTINFQSFSFNSSCTMTVSPLIFFIFSCSINIHYQIEWKLPIICATVILLFLFFFPFAYLIQCLKNS